MDVKAARDIQLESGRWEKGKYIKPRWLKKGEKIPQELLFVYFHHNKENLDCFEEVNSVMRVKVGKEKVVKDILALEERLTSPKSTKAKRKKR